MRSVLICTGGRENLPCSIFLIVKIKKALYKWDNSIYNKNHLRILRIPEYLFPSENEEGSNWEHHPEISLKSRSGLRGH